nr:dehydrin xero 1 [Quercus suber]
MSHYQNQGKKGLTEKIKEKIPGLGRKHNDPYQQGHTTSTTAPGHYKGQQHQQKKGVMEKIKEKLPGHH